MTDDGWISEWLLLARRALQNLPLTIVDDAIKIRSMGYAKAYSLKICFAGRWSAIADLRSRALFKGNRSSGPVYQANAVPCI